MHGLPEMVLLMLAAPAAGAFAVQFIIKRQRLLAAVGIAALPLLIMMVPAEAMIADNPVLLQVYGLLFLAAFLGALIGTGAGVVVRAAWARLSKAGERQGGDAA